MTVDETLAQSWREMRQRNQAADAEPPLHGGGGRGTFGGMGNRVTRPELLTEVIREEAKEHRAEFRETQRETREEFKAIRELLSGLPTKADLNSWRWQWLGMGIGIIALTSGGITDGLALIAHCAG